MAKRRSRQAEEEVELDEVDSFHANKDKMLLEEAGEYGARDEDSEASDEEVMGLEEDSDDDEAKQAGSEDDEEQELDHDGEDGEDDDDDDEDGKGWGGKKNYYGGDDVSDEEDGKQMAEEAMKQQKKHLQELAMDDYIDEDMEEGWKKIEAEKEDNEALKTQFLINKQGSIETLDDNDRLKLLNQLFPEFVPLLQELTSLKSTLKTLQNKPSNPLLDLKTAALSSYLGSISSYFAFFVDNLRTNENFTSMKDNQIMETILSCREVWRQANELPESATEVNDVAIEEEIREIPEAMVSDSEQSDDEVSEQEFVDASESPRIDIDDDDDDDELDIDTRKVRTIKHAPKSKITDFTEGADDVDMEDKQRRKRTLRFYTSKIDQAANKNTEKLTGDSDLPYRERLFERQQRLVEEARKRGLGEKDKNIGADLDDKEFGSDDEQLAGEINENDIEYYEALKQGKQNQKAARRENHEKAVKAAKDGKLLELQEELGASGKRAINYQILKNKGLTPHRKKEFRNSRVKKRMQYEKAKKKLSSIRQVYKGDAKGPYEGEKTGIKKNLSRSVKLV